MRWSDRMEDYRTEVLGLVKAQMVKNAVIVPAGAKGGFLPKQIARNAAREEVQKEGIAAYRVFISALLDLTDNVKDGVILPPARVVRHDPDKLGRLLCALAASPSRDRKHQLAS